MFSSNSGSSCSGSLVSRILEQGQRLRNSMVQTILNNDPFNKEIVSTVSLHDDKGGNSKFDSERETNRGRNHNSVDRERIKAYIQGDEMCMEEEQVVLNRIRSLSPKSLIRTITSDCKCQCSICRDYEKLANFNNNASNPSFDSKPDCDRNFNNDYELKSFKKIRNVMSETQVILKQVDSLKVYIYSLKFNLAGIRKVTSSNNSNFPATNSTYFVEYSLPEIFMKGLPKSKAKVNTGLSPKTNIRYSSKKIQGESIYFKQQTIHTISHVEMLDLSTLNIIFQVGCRNVKQRIPVFFGVAKFNMDALVRNNKFSCDQELVILSENTLVNLGSLKVTIQFGCDRLHFGREFIDAINYDKENCNLSENDSLFQAQAEETKLVQQKSRNVNIDKKNIPSKTDIVKPTSARSARSEVSIATPKSLIIQEPLFSLGTTEPILLYGLIFIQEARILSKPMNYYIVCQGFTNKTDKSFSKVVYNNANPIFNFYQLYPVIYNETFINHLKNTHVSVELWEKAEECNDFVGITKLSLNQLYVIYRDVKIITHLCRNQHPVIAYDWWEPIVSLKANTDLGQLRILVALGTEAQIRTLQCSKEINKVGSPLRSNFTPVVTTSPRTDYFDQPVTEKVTTKTKILADKYVQEPEPEIIPFTKIAPKKIDASTITEKMESQGTNNGSIYTQHGFLNSFIEQLLAAKDLDQRNRHVENSTNTEEVDQNNKTDRIDNAPTQIQENPAASTDNLNNIPKTPILRNTSDLLDSLQQALNIGTPKKEDNVKKTFKAHIVIDSALHLPSRKKCKSKKNRNKHSEEILPSTYVTFKTMADNDLLITSVVPKNKNPHWGYRCDVQLPAELLFNEQKRLVFKVWRKANGPSLQPNLQTDIVLGFAALDLTVLLSGLPNVQGWFNIIDFSNHCNGQMKIHVTPLENLTIFNEYKRSYIPEKLNVKVPEPVTAQEPDEIIPSELLSRALKRKFTELEEITQRLKQRLSTVTNDDSDISNDDFADEFERDLNTECMENERISFDNELNIATNMDTFIINEALDNERVLLMDVKSTKKTDDTMTKPGTITSISEIINKDSLSSASSGIEETENINLPDLSKHLDEGKLKIDTLLQKLTLFTEDLQKNDSNSFSSRYVSGCSISQESEKPMINNAVLLNEGGTATTNKFDANLIFNPSLFQKIFSGSSESTPDLTKPSTHTLHNLVDSFSCSSVETTSSSGSARQAPDGAGNSNNT